MTLTIFSLLVGFFLLGILARKITGKNICALCGAVSLTWVTMLVMYWLGKDVDLLILGVLMGGSAVGFMYYLGTKVPEKCEILKFPFLLTLFWIFYRVLRGFEDVATESIILTGLWIIFGSIFLLYTNNQLRAIGKKLIECCKNW